MGKVIDKERYFVILRMRAMMSNLPSEPEEYGVKEDAIIADMNDLAEKFDITKEEFENA